MILNKLPHDKALHMIGGVLIFAVAIALSLSLWMSLGVVTAVGIGKELVDRMDKLHHTPDIWDAIATASLAAVVAVAMYIRGQM